MKKTIIIAVILGVAAGIGGRMALRSDAGPQAADVLGSAAAADLVSANGTVEGARPEVALRPEVSAILTAVKVRENDDVETGQVVAELSNETQKAQVAHARAELVVALEQLKKLEAGERAQVIARAKAEVEAKAAAHEKARRDADRAQSTAGGLSASDRDGYLTQLRLAKADWDKAKADLALMQEGSRAEDLAAARGQVEVARAKLHAAEADLAKTRLTALTSGKVLQVFAEPGEMASPTSAQPVLLMADLSRRRVRVFVEELDVDRIAVGQPAFVTADGLPGKTFTGKVAVAVPRMGKRAAQERRPQRDEGPLLPRGADRPRRRRRAADEPAGPGPHPGEGPGETVGPIATRSGVGRGRSGGPGRAEKSESSPLFCNDWAGEPMLPSNANGPHIGERRAAERHACKPQLICEVIDPLDETVVPAGAWNVSATGVCVILEPHYARGAHIEVAFHTPDHDTPVRRFAEVVHTVLVPSRREMWLTGCSFSEGLTEGDLGPYA